MPRSRTPKRISAPTQEQRQAVVGDSAWRSWAIAGFVVAAGAAALYWLSPGPSPAVVDVVVPALSARAESGRAAFEANCASCHGQNAAGSEIGPPLVHKIYEPSHHGDGSFYSAVRYGVRAHHWSFGDMPAQPDVSELEMADIIVYVREIQRANGIR